MAPIAIVEHQVPGRLRLTVPDRRGDQGYFDNLAQILTGHPAVRALKIDAPRGGVVIHHEDDVQAILNAATELLEVTEGDPRAVSRAAADTRTIELVERMALVLSTLGLYQIGRGRVLAPASDSLWNAFRAHQQLRSRHLAFSYAMFGVIQLLRSRALGPASSLLFNAYLARHVLQAARRRRRRAMRGSAIRALRQRRGGVITRRS